jgi:hypothetical protein
MQPTLVAGETLNYRATLAEYPASAGWQLTLYVNPRAGGVAQQVVSAPDGDSHLVQAGGATTATWAAGAYAYEIWAALGAERYRLEAGQLQVQASLIGAAAGVDSRSPAQRLLDGLEAAYAAHVASGNAAVGEYTIGNRTMKYRSLAELVLAIEAARRAVQSEADDARIAAGLSARKRWHVRM